jgi:hypothetical protein
MVKLLPLRSGRERKNMSLIYATWRKFENAMLLLEDRITFKY